MVHVNYYQDDPTQSNQLKEESEVNNSNSPFNIYRELEDLEEIITGGSRIPFTELIVLDADLAIEQLNLIKANLPKELEAAAEVVNYRQQIITEAEAFASLVLKSAEEKAKKMLQESAILRQAELDGAKIRLKVEKECEQLKQATIAEVQEMRKNAIAECSAMQQDADCYADGALEDIEQRLVAMLNIVQNGRQQIAETSAE